MVNDLVPVYVPRERLPEVYALLGAPGTSATPAPAQGPTEQPAFPPDLLRTLVKDSPPGMRVILEALAVKADTWLTADDLAEALRDRLPTHGGPEKPNADWKTVAGTLGAFGRRFKNHYSATYPNWPFELRNDFGRERWLYMMRADIAQFVLTFLAEA